MKHPLSRRLIWHPAIAAVPLIWFAIRLATGTRTLNVIAGSIVVGVWFFLAVCDIATKHRVLDWLYSDDGQR